MKPMNGLHSEKRMLPYLSWMQKSRLDDHALVLTKGHFTPLYETEQSLWNLA